MYRDPGEGWHVLLHCLTSTRPPFGFAAEFFSSSAPRDHSRVHQPPWPTVEVAVSPRSVDNAGVDRRSLTRLGRAALRSGVRRWGWFSLVSLSKSGAELGFSAPSPDPYVVVFPIEPFCPLDEAPGATPGFSGNSTDQASGKWKRFAYRRSTGLAGR